MCSTNTTTPRPLGAVPGMAPGATAGRGFLSGPFWAMTLKELRETRAILLLALAAFAYLVAVKINPHLPFGRGDVIFIPFVQDTFLDFYIPLAGALAIAVGLRQTLGESVPGTYAFLYHRPASRRWIIGVKLLVGLGGCLVCSMLPIVVYSLWAAAPGTHASPFEWSMTIPSWIMWLAMTIIYLGTFLTGIRPGRWYRSRVLPLVAAALLTIMAVGVGAELGMWALSVLSILLVDAWLVAVIFFVARTRDYS